MRSAISAMLLMGFLLAASADELSHKSVPRLSDADLESLQQCVAQARHNATQQTGEHAQKKNDDAEYLRSLANMIDTLSVQQQKVPAYRDLYQKSIEQLETGLSESNRAGASTETIRHPVIAHVDFPNVLVRQAYWDEATETLWFTLEPQKDSLTATFRIENLYTNYLAVLYQNGEWRAAVDEHAQAAGPGTRNLDPGQIEIRTALSGPTQFVLKPME